MLYRTASPSEPLPKKASNRFTLWQMEKLYYIAKLLRPDSLDEKHPDVFSKIFFRGVGGGDSEGGGLEER